MLPQTADLEFNATLAEQPPPQVTVAFSDEPLLDDKIRLSTARALSLAMLMALPCWGLIAFAIYLML